MDRKKLTALPAVLFFSDWIMRFRSILFGTRVAHAAGQRSEKFRGETIRGFFSVRVTVDEGDGRKGPAARSENPLTLGVGTG
jgi:hypothetical protein